MGATGGDPDPRAPATCPQRTIRGQAYDDAGRLVRDLQVDDPGPGTRFHMVTGVREHEGRIWMGSLHEPAVALLEP